MGAPENLPGRLRVETPRGGLSIFPRELPMVTPDDTVGQYMTAEHAVTAEVASREPAVPTAGGAGKALTVAEAMVERPRSGARDDGILGDPCFGGGVGAKGEHVERKRGDDPQGAGVHGPGQL